MSSNISRRSVAKGAAWALPTVAIASAAPAFASSQPSIYSYKASYYSSYVSGGGSCTTTSGAAGDSLTDLSFTNQYQKTPTDPQGFSIYRDYVNPDGTGTYAPASNVTVTDLVMTVAYPTGMATGSPTFVNGTDGNWTYVESKTNQRMTDANSQTVYMDVFTFSWKGNGTSQAAVEYPGSTSWSNTALELDFPYNSNYCVSSAAAPEFNYTLNGTYKANVWNNPDTISLDKWVTIEPRIITG